MAAPEQVYYEALVRTDHPVFYKDYSPTTTVNSPVNSIFNRIMAKQVVRLRLLIEEIRLNMYPSTVTALTISDWENEFFGFTKPSLDLPTRISELLIKFNKRFTMSVSDVFALSESIVGSVPIVTRNVGRQGWILGTGILGAGTVLANPSDPGSEGLYLVYFTEPVDSTLLAQLDNSLTTIEKAGSRHIVKAPIQRWILGRTPLGSGTTLGAN